MSEFDESVGLGTITASDGCTYLFHCTQIADGTRTIAVGTEVEFDVWPRFGQYEAAKVRPAP